MNLQGKRVMVIGGSGFLGSHLVDKLLDTDIAEVIVYGSLRQAPYNLPNPDNRVRLIEGSVTDMASLITAMDGSDGVFLLASLWLKECLANPRAGLDVNVNGGFNVLEACKIHNVQRLVFASSSVVYGTQDDIHFTEAHPLNSTTMYGATKIAIEQFMRAFYSMYHLPSVSCRFTNIYGTRQATKGNATSVIVRFLQRIVNNQAPMIFGDGSQGFDFINVKDAARATLLAMTSDVEQADVNIASGNYTTLTELAETLLEFTGSSLAPEYQSAANNAVKRMTYSTDYAQQQLRFKAEISLRDGLREMVEWYLQKEEKA